MSQNEYYLIHSCLWSNDFLFSFGNKTPQADQVQNFLIQEFKGIDF